jgi:hypothetical protein
MLRSRCHVLVPFAVLALANFGSGLALIGGAGRSRLHRDMSLDGPAGLRRRAGEQRRLFEALAQQTGVKAQVKLVKAAPDYGAHKPRPYSPASPVIT